MIGREKQLEQIELLQTSKKSEFVAVMGRRRVGKTYLIDNAFSNQICFQISGIQDENMQEQLANFYRKLCKYSKVFLKKEIPYDWGEAFYYLEMYLSKLPKRKKKYVIFLDELPWMATQRSGCLQQLANFWNDFLSKQKNFILVVCGSASSWLAKNISADRGGLHNRLTDIVHVHPFTLKETKQFFKSKKIELTHVDIAKIYMAIGGIPYYLEDVRVGDSATTAINRILFSKESKLAKEYDHLYKALFYNPSIHQKIVSILSSSQKGLLRNQILAHLKVISNGSVNRALDELVTCGFISTISQYNKRKREELYRLTDEYTLFYHKFIKHKHSLSKGVWDKLSTSHTYTIWCGYAYEFLVYRHIEQVMQKLGISGISSNISVHYYLGNKSNNQQIDLLIERADNTITYCEIKFNKDPIGLDKKKYQELKTKIANFRLINSIKKNIHVVYITNEPMLKNSYFNEVVAHNITLDDLFN